MELCVGGEGYDMELSVGGEGWDTELSIGGEGWYIELGVGGEGCDTKLWHWWGGVGILSLVLVAGLGYGAWY